MCVLFQIHQADSDAMKLRKFYKPDIFDIIAL